MPFRAPAMIVTGSKLADETATEFGANLSTAIAFTAPTFVVISPGMMMSPEMNSPTKLPTAAIAPAKNFAAVLTSEPAGVTVLESIFEIPLETDPLGAIAPANVSKNTRALVRTPAGVIVPVFRAEISFESAPAAVSDPANVFEASFRIDPAGVTEPAMLKRIARNVASVAAGVTVPVLRVEISFVRDAAGVTVPVFRSDTSFDRIADGVIEPARLRIITRMDASVPAGVTVPDLRIEISFARMPAGVTVPDFDVLISFVSNPVGVTEPVKARTITRIAAKAPEGVTVPDLSNEASFMRAPAGVMVPDLVALMSFVSSPVGVTVPA